MDNRDKLILEQIEWDLQRLAMQANAIKQPLLAYVIDMARLEARNALDGTSVESPP